MRAFAHGTSAEAAQNIVETGLSEQEARAGYTGGQWSTPGALHTVEIDPDNPSETLEIAHGFGGEGSQMVVLYVPEPLYQSLVSEGSIVVEKPPGWTVPQTVFTPDSFADS